MYAITSLLISSYLNVVRVLFLFWEKVEAGKVIATTEQTSRRVVPEIET